MGDSQRMTEEFREKIHSIQKELERLKKEKTDVLGGEGAIVPLILKTLLYPFSIQQYIKSAQRSGVHVAISPSKEGVMLYSCGLALDELTGKPAKYVSDENLEEITDTMELLRQ
jgi:hypothetical protein